MDFRGAVENCSVKNGVKNAVENVVETSVEKGVKNPVKNVVETSVKTYFGECIPGPCEEWRGKAHVEI